MAATLAQDSEEQQVIITGLNAQLCRVQREERELFVQLTATNDEQRTTELLDRTIALRDTRKSLNKQKEIEEASLAQKLLCAQMQNRGLPNLQSTSLINAVAPLLPSRIEQNVVDLAKYNSEEPRVFRPAKRERSSTPDGEATSASNEQKRRKTSEPSGIVPQPFVKREYSPPNICDGVSGIQHSLLPTGAVESYFTEQERPTQGSRAKPWIFSQFPSHRTVINLLNGGGAVELRCDICGGNANPSGLKWIMGPLGFLNHFRNRHHVLLGPTEHYSLKGVIERCTVHHLTHTEVEAVQAGDMDAYVVKMIPCVGGPNHAPRGKKFSGLTEATASGPHPYGRSADENTEDEEDELDDVRTS